MGRAFRQITGRAFSGLTCLCALMLCGFQASAEEIAPKIQCLSGLRGERREALAGQLRAITGWGGLHFDEGGGLRFGKALPEGGSPTARALLASAQSGKRLIVVEDASGRADVVFARVVEGRWKTGSAGRPQVFMVQVDFRDFSHVMGDREALAAFNPAWGLLHEIDHVVRDSSDPVGPGAEGECEAYVNRMRRECGLPERVEYYYTLFPGAEQAAFRTRFVRLAFERVHPQNKRRRYWVLWDATLTGGTQAGRQVAAR